MFIRASIFVLIAFSFVFSYSIIPKTATYHLGTCMWSNIFYPCELDSIDLHSILSKFNIATEMECLGNCDNNFNNRQDAERVVYIGIVDSIIDSAFYVFNYCCPVNFFASQET